MEEQDYITIERYLQGDLSPEEIAVLESRINEVPELAEALAERKLLNAHLRAAGQEDALRNTLRKLEQQYFRPAEAPVRRISHNRGWYGIAAAAVIALAVLLVGPWLFSGEGGYEQFAQHDPLSLTERGASPELATKAAAAFNEERYFASIPLLREYLKEQPNDERAQLALGIALLETDKDEEAIVIFARIAQGQSSLAPYGNWYLALSAVKRGDNVSAVKYLDLIPPTDAYLTAKANELRATF